MLLKSKLTPVIAVIFCIASACSRGPKFIETPDDNLSDEKNSGIYTENPSMQSKQNTNQSFADDLHTVVINEVLPTTKYVYLNVTEGNEQFWIATVKQPVKVGKKYYYRGGLLKTNFESTEYKRVFEKIYLVTSLVAENHGVDSGIVNKTISGTEETKTVQQNNSVINTTGKIDNKNSIKIAELVKNKIKYEGKSVQISGKCVKINPNIMGRNWIHLKDGTWDDFDLVITSNTFVPVGSVVTMTAVVALNKDFGAGYKYDIILENGALVP